MKAQTLIIHILLYVGSFLVLWLTGVGPGTGWDALIAAAPSALVAAWDKTRPLP